MSKRRDPSPEFDLFIPALGDLPLRDQREVMERPFFSLQKRKRLKPIEYRSPDGEAWVRVQAIPDYGMATIWDADILIWAASTQPVCFASAMLSHRAGAARGCEIAGNAPCHVPASGAASGLEAGDMFL